VRSTLPSVSCARSIVVRAVSDGPQKVYEARHDRLAGRFAVKLWPLTTPWEAFRRFANRLRDGPVVVFQNYWGTTKAWPNDFGHKERKLAVK